MHGHLRLQAILNTLRLRILENDLIGPFAAEGAREEEITGPKINVRTAGRS
jgi:hypothetical protein